MAAPLARRFLASGFQKSREAISVRHIVPPISFQVRTSVYRPTFVDPLVQKSDLPDDNAELGERLFKPVKAMLVSQRCSFTYDPLIERFINCVMIKGERALAKEIVTKAFEKVKLIQVEKYHKAETEDERARIECDPVVIFHQAYENVRPVLRFMPVVRGGTVYQVPIAARPNQSELTAFKWIRDSAKNKVKRISFWDSLARELLDAFQNTGKSVRKKQELHHQCEANKAYAHFRWTK